MSKEEQKNTETTETEEEVLVEEEASDSDEMSSEDAQSEQSGGVFDKFSSKNIAAGAVVVALVAGVFWIAAGGGGNWFSSKEVVATVNGENITQEMLENRINQSRALYEEQGADFDDAETYGMVEQQVLQSMVQEMLITQDAEAQNITATQEEIDVELQQIEAQFGSDEEFAETLDTYNMTMDDLKENIRVQVIIQNYLDANISDEALDVTEEEVNEFYAMYSEGDDSAAPLSEVREQIEVQLSQQKRQAEIERIIQALEAAGNVELFV